MLAAGLLYMAVVYLRGYAIIGLILFLLSTGILNVLIGQSQMDSRVLVHLIERFDDFSMKFPSPRD
jgi:hypothetical protein